MATYYYQCRICVRVPVLCGLWHKKEFFDSMLIFATEEKAYDYGKDSYKLFLFIKWLEESRCKLLDIQVNSLILAER